MLRKRFSGKAEHVVTFFHYIANEVREYLAQLGFRSIEEAVGHAEVLDMAPAIDHWKSQGLDLSPVLHQVDIDDDAPLRRTTEQDHALDDALDNQLIASATASLRNGTPVRLLLDVQNTSRSVGAMLPVGI